MNERFSIQKGEILNPKRMVFVLLSTLVSVCGLAMLLTFVSEQAGLASASPGSYTGASIGDLSGAATVTVSGTITHGGNPIAGVKVEVHWSGGDQTLITLADGIYQANNVPSGSWVIIYVYPPVAMGLEFRAWQTNTLSADLLKDFDLASGYRLEAEFHNPDGSIYTARDLLISPLAKRMPSGEILPPPIGEIGEMDMVLAPGFYAIYKIGIDETPYYMPPTIYDLRGGGIISEVITLLNRPVPHPTSPPVASLISISSPDIDGYVTVSGAPGAVPPHAALMVLNQSAANLAMTASDASGAFSAELYAPDGSWLLVKYDLHGDTLYNLWTDRALGTNKEDGFASQEAVQDLPGVTIYAGSLPEGGDGWQDFTAVGRQVWWAGWSISGTLETPSITGLNVMPGDTITLSVLVAAHSPMLNCSGTPTYTVSGGASLVEWFGDNGRAKSWGTWFESHLFTPTGLPIEHEAPTPSKDLGAVIFSNHTCLSEHTLIADLDFSVALPADLSDGIYSLSLNVLPNLPADTSVPSIPVWHHENENAFLPPIRVGDPEPPRIPWYLLMNHPVDGYRGLGAIQDRGDFALPNRVRFESHTFVLPRLDDRSGEPIPYRLEPGSYWISGDDRRTPNPPRIPLYLPSGGMSVMIDKPDETVDVLGPAPFMQTDIRTPSLADGSELDESTGNMCDVYHLTNVEETFVYTFTQYGPHQITLEGEIYDIYGNPYAINSTYEVLVARVLDLDPAQLPTTPYHQGDAFAPGLLVFPPMPAKVDIRLSHLPNSDPALEITRTFSGQANRFGYFQPPPGPAFYFELPGEFRVDMTASYTTAGGDLWAGAMTWGGVVEGLTPRIEAHGRRGLNFPGDKLDDTPAWYVTAQLTPTKIGTEQWIPYYSGDIVWAAEANALIMEDQSLLSIVTVRDLTGISEQMYDVIRNYYERCTDPMAGPPLDTTLTGLEKRIDIGEAPLCIATYDGSDAESNPDKVEYWGYWYSTSERPDVHVREIIGQDGVSTAYWRFNDTYGYQIGEPADGDQEGDLKWNFGGAVMRLISETNPVNEYAIHGALWVLLPLDDPIGPRVTPPFQDATGASINGGPIMELLGQEIDMLFLPKGVRPGGILELGDMVSLSGHVGPMLDSRVIVTVTSPGMTQNTGDWHANKIGWLYDPDFDFVANEVGRWTVEVQVEHDRPYPPNNITPASHNTGTVLGTHGQYEFYVVDPNSQPLHINAPDPGFITWPNWQIEPITITGRAPVGTNAVRYSIHDKGIVMDQGLLTPTLAGKFTLVYDAEALHQDFPMLSLTAREGRWEGLADEVTISFMTVGSSEPAAATVTLIGEEVFVQGGPEPVYNFIYLPIVSR